MSAVCIIIFSAFSAYLRKVKFDNTTSAIYSDLSIRLHKLDFKSSTSQKRHTEVSLFIETNRNRPNPSKLDGQLIVTEKQQPTESSSYINIKNDAVYKLVESHERATKTIAKLRKLCKRL